MATLKQLRTRLKSMNSTRKITSAMKLVAASRWRRQQAKWKALKDYTETFDDEVVNLVARRLKKQNTSAAHILVVCSPHKGLCGGYPSSVKQTVGQVFAAHNVDRVIVTTEKGKSLLSDIKGMILCEVMPSEAITASIAEWHDQGHKVSVIRGVSRNAMAQEAELMELIPYGLSSESTTHEVTCEPDMETLTPVVMQHALMMRWQCAWLGSVVAEEAARMSAMDQATRNADDAIALLQRTYNRMRQEKITTELVEMISGSALA